MVRCCGVVVLLGGCVIVLWCCGVVGWLCDCVVVVLCCCVVVLLYCCVSWSRGLVVSCVFFVVAAVRRIIA